MTVACKSIPKKSSSATKHKIVNGGTVKLNGAALTILNTVAALKVALNKESVDRKKLPGLTNIKGKSTIANALTKLKNAGLLEVTPDSVTVTALGIAAADPQAMEEAAANVPTTNDEYHTSVKQQHKLKTKECAMIDLMKDGRTYSKKVVAETIGCKMNSTFANMLTHLKKCSIISFDRETMQLTDDMFPIQARVGNTDE